MLDFKTSILQVGKKHFPKEFVCGSERIGPLMDAFKVRQTVHVLSESSDNLKLTGFLEKRIKMVLASLGIFNKDAKEIFTLFDRYRFCLYDLRPADTLSKMNSVQISFS